MYKVYCDGYLIFDPKVDSLKIYNPKLDLEVNKAGAFTFTIYPSHPHFSRPKKLKSIIQVYQQDHLLFRGRILNDEQGWNNEKQVTCEGELAFLIDSIQRPYDFMSGDLHTTISDLFTFFINNHNAQVEEAHRFTVGTISVTDPNNYIVRADSTYLNTWDSINKKLIEGYGGYLQVRHEADGNYIDYLEDFDTINQQTVEFEKNLLDVAKTTKGEETITALIPLGCKCQNGEDRLTISDLPDTQEGDSADIWKSGDYVYSRSAVQQYGWIFGTAAWDDVTTASALLTKGTELLSTSINLSVSVDLTAADLASVNSSVEAFRIGSYIRAYTQPHGINSTLLVRKLSIDLLSPKSNKMTLGLNYSTFTEQTNGAAKEYSSVVQRVDSVQNQVGTLQEDMQSQINSVTEQLPDTIIQRVSESYYTKDEAETLVESMNTQFSQTNSMFNFQFEKFNLDLDSAKQLSDAQFQEIKKYIRFVDGNIVLGEEGNELTLKIQNDRISFLQNNVEVACFSNRKMYVTDGEFINSLRLGSFSFMPRANGNLSFKKVVT